MNRLILLTLIFLPYVFSSCSKNIEGKVFDNFGKPLKDVGITISNTQYQAQTSSSGEYSIDYTAGEVILNFKKEGYLSSGEVLYITEKNTYPLKDIVLYKKPEKFGIYIASPEIGDYVRLKPYTNIKGEMADNKRTVNLFLNDLDSVQVIKLSSLDDLKLYNYNLKKHLLTKVGADKEIAEVTPGLFGTSVKPNNPVVGVLDKISSKIETNTFFAEFGVNYACLFEDGLKNRNNPSLCAFIFRLEKK